MIALGVALVVCGLVSVDSRDDWYAWTLVALGLVLIAMTWGYRTMLAAAAAARGERPPSKPLVLHVNPPADLREANERWMEHKAWTPEDVA